MNNFTNEQVRQILIDALVSPKSVKNDAGEVESQDLDDVVKALKYAGSLGASSNPFSCLKQADVRFGDVWQERPRRTKR